MPSVIVVANSTEPPTAKTLSHAAVSANVSQDQHANAGPSTAAMYGLAASVFFVAGFAALAVDLTVTKLFLAVAAPTEWLKTVDLLGQLVSPFQFFANGVTVVAILVVMFRLDPATRRCWRRLVWLVFGSCGLALVLKTLIVRLRPKEIVDPQGLPVIDVWSTFRGLAPMTNSQHHLQSTPSGHTAIAVGLAIALAWRYPRARHIFFTFAGLAAVQRVVFGDHYVSDVLWGAAAACLMATVFFSRRLLGGRHDRLEGNHEPPALAAGEQEFASTGG